jgi:acyl-CoA thioester hydrolase
VNLRNMRSGQAEESRGVELAMAAPFTLRRRVLFWETDLAGIMHFSNFFRWMEEAEHAFYRSLGLSVHPLQGGVTETRTGWPRVQAKCDYLAPLKFEEEVDVEVSIQEIGTKSIRYAFVFRKTDSARTIAAQGELVVVSIRADLTTQRMSAIPIPEEFRTALETYQLALATTQPES